MSLLKKFIHSISAQERRRAAGRWNLEHCISKTNLKVDYANEDHCGVCVDAKSKHIEKTTFAKKELFVNADDDYIRYMM